jgi:hypothetical protein
VVTTTAGDQGLVSVIEVEVSLQLVLYCRPLPPAVPVEVAVLIGTAG